MAIPEIEEVSDERLTYLLDYSRFRRGFFVNNAILGDELSSLVIEVQRSRKRELHCPCCDGDHL